MDTMETAARLLGPPAAIILPGYMLSSSNVVPLIYGQPASISTQIFSGVYHRGAAMVIPASIISTLASGYLAYAFPSQRAVHATAGALTFSILPFTQLFMFKGINRLLDLGSAPAAEQEKAGQSGEVDRLLESWVAHNWVRVGLTFAGAMTGLWAMYVDRR